MCRSAERRDFLAGSITPAIFVMIIGPYAALVRSGPIKRPAEAAPQRKGVRQQADGTQTSNRKVPCSELDGIDGDLPAKPYIEEQDRKIAEMSGKPRGPIKSVTRASRR